MSYIPSGAAVSCPVVDALWRWWTMQTGETVGLPQDATRCEWGLAEAGAVGKVADRKRDRWDGEVVGVVLCFGVSVRESQSCEEARCRCKPHRMGEGGGSEWFAQ